MEILGSCLSDRSWWVRSNAGMGLFACGKKGIQELHRIAEQSDDKFARDMAMRTLTSDPLYHAFGQDSGLLTPESQEATP